MPRPCPLNAGRPAGFDPAPVWAVTYHPTQRAAAYCGDSGILGLVPVEPPLVNRRHAKPAAALSAIAVDAGDAWVLTADMLPGNAGLYPGGANHRDAPLPPGGRGTLADPKQALHAAAFSPNCCGGAAALAAGGAVGLVRVHRVMVVVEGGADVEEWAD